MKREYSAGGIVFNDQGQVLLVQHSTLKHWGFPKGHLETGQTSKEAALREVKEEGGVDVEIISKIGDSKYVYTHPQSKERIFKIVTLYLMKYKGGNVKEHDWEVSEAVWLSPEEALKRLTFNQDKELLKKALEIKKTINN